MGLTYFKRFRMEIDLVGRSFAPGRLPEGYVLEPWRMPLLEEHAETKFQSFRSEIDASVFPCFAERSGCLRLMDEIVSKEGFLPEATWLIVCEAAGPQRREPCGTIQGLRDVAGYGAIQNVGITPHHRNRGLGSELVCRALAGFQRNGLARAYLEVTAQNQAAINLYQRIGFQKVRTLYKAVEVAYT